VFFFPFLLLSFFTFIFLSLILYFPYFFKFFSHSSHYKSSSSSYLRTSSPSSLPAIFLSLSPSLPFLIILSFVHPPYCNSTLPIPSRSSTSLSPLSSLFSIYFSSPFLFHLLFLLLIRPYSSPPHFPATSPSLPFLCLSLFSFCFSSYSIIRSSYSSVFVCSLILHSLPTTSPTPLSYILPFSFFLLSSFSVS
jgi:hypothetical protein